jgi:cysteine-rich repeat protein
VLLAAVSALVLGCENVARAANFEIVGRLLRLTGPSSALMARSQDPSIQLPSADPGMVGGSLEVTIMPGTGPTQSQTFPLLPGGWSSTANRRFYRAAGGPGAIKSVMIRAGQIAIRGTHSFSLAGAPITRGEVDLIIGSDRYCSDFATAANPNTPQLVRWRLQLTPGQCPAPPTTTTITTTTTTTTTTLPPNCGNGNVEAGETCDDANVVPCDGCTACQIDACGDNNLCTNQGEQCDDGNLAPGDGCNGLCEIESSSCTNPPIGTRLVVVSINTPEPLAAVQIDLEYPQLQTSIPGTGLSSLVQNRTFFFQSAPSGNVAVAFDRDSELSTILASSDAFIESGPLMAVNFDECVAANKKVCNRAQTVIDCCNNTADPGQFGDFCNATIPPKSIACASDAGCPAQTNDNCIAASNPYACCTGAGIGTCDSTDCVSGGDPFACCTGSGIGNCEAQTRGCLGPGNPFPCCTGANQGLTCAFVGGLCNFICPANPPLCAINTTTGLANFSTTVVGPCQGSVCSNNATRPCLVNADCVAPGVCTGIQQSGACPGDNVCVPQTGPGGITSCSVSSPVDTIGNPVSGVTCSVLVL